MEKPRVALPGSYRPPAPKAESVGPADATEQTFVTVHVRRKEEPLPITSAGTHLSHEEYTAMHGASANDFLAVREFAKEYRLEPKNESASKRSIELPGTVADLSRAFGTSVEHVKINGRG